MKMDSTMRIALMVVLMATGHFWMGILFYLVTEDA